MRHDRSPSQYQGTGPDPVAGIALAGIVYRAWHLQLSQSYQGVDLDAHLYGVVDWTGQFVPSVGAAIYDIALYTFYFVAFRVFCERRGLAVRHFHWSLTQHQVIAPRNPASDDGVSARDLPADRHH